MMLVFNLAMSTVLQLIFLFSKSDRRYVHVLLAVVCLRLISVINTDHLSHIIGCILTCILTLNFSKIWSGLFYVLSWTIYGRQYTSWSFNSW